MVCRSSTLDDRLSSLGRHPLKIGQWGSLTDHEACQTIAIVGAKIGSEGAAMSPDGGEDLFVYYLLIERDLLRRAE
jgi:hypothetical protein